MPEEFNVDDYRTPDQKAREWGVKPDTVRWWLRRKPPLIPAVKIGQRYYIHRDVKRPGVEHIGPTS